MLSNKTKTVVCKISVHWIQADIITALQEGRICLPNDSLRSIAKSIGGEDIPPQQIKHHLMQLVKLGAVSIIDGAYSYEK